MVCGGGGECKGLRRSKTVQGNEEFNLPMLDICSLSGIEGDMSRRKSDVDSSMVGSTGLRREWLQISA